MNALFHKKYATYCEKCGYIDMSTKLSVCPFCGETLKNSDWSRRDIYAREEWELNWIKDDIDNRFVKNNPLIDQAAYQSRTQQENEQQKATTIINRTCVNTSSNDSRNQLCSF